MIGEERPVSAIAVDRIDRLPRGRRLSLPESIDATGTEDVSEALTVWLDGVVSDVPATEPDVV